LGPYSSKLPEGKKNRGGGHVLLRGCLSQNESIDQESGGFIFETKFHLNDRVGFFRNLISISDLKELKI